MIFLEMTLITNEEAIGEGGGKRGIPKACRIYSYITWQIAAKVTIYEIVF